MRSAAGGRLLPELSNLNGWKRLGCRPDVAKPGSDKLIDAVVAYGTADDVAKRLGEHLSRLIM